MAEYESSAVKYYPNQRVSESVKTDKKWYIPTIEYWINRAVSFNDKDIVQNDLLAANGYIPPGTYDYVTKPLSKDGDQITKLPGEIRDVDFLTPIKEKHLGEYIELPYTFHVTVDNPIITLERDVSLKKLKAKLVDQAMVNIMNQYIDTGAPSVGENIDVSGQIEDFLNKWAKEKGIKAKRTLTFLNHLTDFETRRINAFFYYWATEQFFTYRYIDGNAVRVELVPPLNGYPVDNGEEYVEDMKGFLIRDSITYQELIDNYRNDISEEERKYLEDFTKNKYFGGGDIIVKAELITKYNKYDFYANKSMDKIPDIKFGNKGEVERSVMIFTSEKKVNILTYTDELGKEHEKYVPEDYKVNKNIGDVGIQTDWINTVYIATRLGPKYSGIYVAPEEVEVQRRDLNNPSLCKLPVGGKTRMLVGNTPNPIPRRLVTYLALYRIMTLQLERTIAKHKGDVELIPKGMLYDPDVKMSDVWLYRMADNTIIYDENKVDFQTVVQGYRIVGNRGLSDYIRSLIELRNSIKADAWEAAHMNDSRYGNINPRAGKGVTEHNIFRAKLGSYLLIYTFNMALEKDHMADLEYSKYAWINGKKGSYRDESNKIVDIEIDGPTHLASEHGVFVADTMIEDSKLREFKELAFAASQNGDFSLAAKAINSNSTHEIDTYIEKFVEETKTFEASQADREGQAVQAASQQEHQQDIELEQVKGDVEGQNIVLQGEIDLTKLQVESSIVPGDDGSKVEGNIIKQANDAVKNALASTKQELNERIQSHRERDDAVKNKLKAEDTKSKERIAKENKNKYDK